MKESNVQTTTQQPAAPPVNDLPRKIRQLPVSEAYGALDTAGQGISPEEAQMRLKKYDKNTIQEKKGQPLIWKFLSNFIHLMAILLWAAGIITLIAGMSELVIAVWMVNVINGVFSFWREFRAGKATEALKKLLPDYVRVLHGGEELRLLAEGLIPGDIMLSSEDDMISTDARLVEDNDLRVNQSTPTGELNPVHEARNQVLRTDVSTAESPSLIFAGTTVSSGIGKAIVCSIGMDTEFGRTAGLTQGLKDESSPLQKEMGSLTRKVSAIAVSIGILFFILVIFLAKSGLVATFIFALGMIVTFVPEGLLPTVTLSLAMGVQRIVKRNALIKRLSTVEALGCTTVIYTDKTGILTQNEMTVSNVWLDGRDLGVTGVGYNAEGGQILEENGQPADRDNSDLCQLLTGAGLYCDARPLSSNEENTHYTVLGDPTEAALLVVVKKNGLNLDELSTMIPRLHGLPLDSGRKRISTVHQPQSGSRLVYVKGAPEEMLDLCARWRGNGMVSAISDDGQRHIMTVSNEYVKKDLRVLAVACRELTGEIALPTSLSEYTSKLIEQDLTFPGLIAMVDPPRPEVAAAVKKCHRAGIRIIMIIDDYGLTAESIARRIGIISDSHPRIITGLELETMNQKDLEEALKDEVIPARAVPGRKLQVASALQDVKQIVAVTGDGINDSPALKKADTDVVMDRSGTDVAKEAADMILTDDNFASIVSATEEGRAVYSNIRHFVLYIFTSNMSCVVPMVLHLFSGGLVPLPLTIMQILAIDLGTDMVPTTGLDSEAPEEGMMGAPLRSRKDVLLNRPLIFRAFLWYDMLEAIFGIAAYFFLSFLMGWPAIPLASEGLAYRMTTSIIFAAIVLSQVGAVFACRTDRTSVFEIGLFSDRLTLVGITVEFTLLACLVFLPLPFLHNLLNMVPLPLNYPGMLLFVPFTMLLVDKARKWFLCWSDRRKKDNNDQPHTNLPKDTEREAIRRKSLL